MTLSSGRGFFTVPQPVGRRSHPTCSYTRIYLIPVHVVSTVKQNTGVPFSEPNFSI